MIISRKEKLSAVFMSFKLNRLYCLLFCVLGLNGYAEDVEYAEFDAGFLYGNQNKENIDMSRFSYGNPIPAGEYLSDVYLNNELRGRIRLHFVEDNAQNKSVLCASETLLELLDLRKIALATDKVVSGSQCVIFTQKVPKAKVHFDLGEFRLDVDIPQAFVEQRPPGYISPIQWQSGVPVAFLRYDATHYRYSYLHTQAYQTYLGINAGVNIFGWSFRHRGNVSWDKQKRSPYQKISTYAQHDVPALRGQFTIGDFYTTGALMDSIAIRGMQLTSDDRMLATSVRGYAPTIRGVANSNAVVTIRQNGNILREIAVPAGPFTIDDLYPTGYGGDLLVEILEANGEKRSFTVPFTAAVQLIRPGYSNYQIAMGRYRYGDRVFKENVAQVTWQYGVNNNLTLNVGGILAKNYHSELIGLAFNTPIGAFSANSIFSNARFKTITSQDKYKGYSLSFSYNTRLEPTNTNVTLAAYRYLSRYYYSLQDVMLANNASMLDQPIGISSANGYRPKNQFQVSINQTFNEKWGSAYLTGSTYTYWGTSKKQNEYQIGYSNTYKRLNYSLSFTQVKNNFSHNDQRIYLSLSLPLGNDDSVSYLSQNINYVKSNGYAAYTSLSGSLGQERRYSYNLSVGKQQASKTSNLIFSQSYLGSLARVDSSWSQTNKGNKQLSIGVSGAVVLHSKGITLANDLGETFAIIYAKGARGAKIRGSIGNEVDYFGNGIVPYVDPYTINYVGLDDLPGNVELSATEQQLIPRANQAMLVNFSTKIGNVVFFEITNKDDLPPLGTDVVDQENKSVGMLAQGGKIYTRGIAPIGQLNIIWGEKRCRIDYQIPSNTNNGKPLVMPVKCQFY